LALFAAFAAALAAALLAVPSSLAGHVVDSADVKVTNDNNNVDGGTPNPGFDAQNRQQNETTTAFSHVNPNIIAVGANDYRMVTVTADVWVGFYVSADGGGTWFNTFVPGFPSDTSPAGLASPLKGLDAAGDPVVRFAADGDLLVGGIAFNRNFDQPDRPVDNLVFVARYNYTPGSPGGVSTPNSAANPPNFTYVGTTVIERGAIGFAVPGSAGFAGVFTDKDWMEVDLNAPSASPCAGNVYFSHTDFHANFGSSSIKVSVSDDGGATFTKPKVVSTGGTGGTPFNEGVDVAIGADGAVYVAYEGFKRSTGQNTINVVKSTDCGRKWGQPVEVAAVEGGQAPGVAFRTPTFAFLATDDTDADVVYVAYQSLDGDYDIYANRSTDGGETWESAVQVNEDPGSHQQIFPTIEVSHGALHAAWYDTRNSAPGANDMVDVYYASSNTTGVPYPAFSHNVRVSDVSHNGNCLLFGGGTAAFHGDYIELDARWTGVNHIVEVSWADTRDVSPCDLDPAAGPPSNNTGNRNDNIYASQLVVQP
jgi:hypothetical protein